MIDIEFENGLRCKCGRFFGEPKQTLVGLYEYRCDFCRSFVVKESADVNKYRRLLTMGDGKTRTPKWY